MRKIEVIESGTFLSVFKLTKEQTQFLNEHNYVIVDDEYVVVYDEEGGYYLANIVRSKYDIELNAKRNEMTYSLNYEE